jgi:hypothetical protein
MDIISARNSTNCSEGRNAIFKQVFKDSGRHGIFSAAILYVLHAA